MATAKETRKLGNFTIVELFGYGELFIEQTADAAASPSITIEADESIAPRVGSKVWGNRLRLGMIMPWYEWFSFWWTWLFAPKTVTYRLTANKIEGLEITGSGTLTAGEVRTDRCALVVRGSGKIRFHGALMNLSSLITGSGDIECRGKVERHEIRVTGSGSVQAAALEAKDVSVRITGSGGVKVCAGNSLDVAITGSGNVTYAGQPKLQTRITGSGRVIQEKASR
jgi:hypothetical protein